MADETCTGNKLWYVCIAGHFRGCCSSNPCTSGICPDDDTSSLSVTSVSSTSSSIFESPTAISTAMTSTKEVDSSSASSTSLTSTPITGVDSLGALLTTTTGTQATKASAATSTSNSTPTSPSRNSSNVGGIFGGTVGAVVGLVLCGTLFFIWRRRKRQRVFNINLHPSVSTCSLHKREITPITKTVLSTGDENQPLRSDDERELDRFAPGEHKPESSVLTNSVLPRFSTARSNPGISIHNPDTSNLSLTIPASSSTPSLSSGYPTIEDLSQVHPKKHVKPAELPASTPRGIGFTPELYDTGFYRQRAELAEQSQRELINIPLEQRRRQNKPRSRHHKPGARSCDSSSPRTPSSATSNETMSPRLMSRQTARRVLTTEGVVLGATLDSHDSAEQDHILNPNRLNTADHVMSFMDYELVTRSAAGLSTETSTEGQTIPTLTTLEEDPLSPLGDAPPAYNAEGAVSQVRDTKSPHGTLGCTARRE
ncbi:hypothetical protein N7495_009546 [Penicillium taxi]|uniref:uncharacterized protein n=1 Tax=Penicillium taxi TaxID=168475 RepID=UPI0025454C0E|nr:uncharacterized protein N7495_009546 [Penicillium taxi]KAJ5885036.1 hypothetical protein N7495_009546 [Penicillium taxi]